MKIKPKKLMTLLVSAMLTVSSLSLSSFSALAEESTTTTAETNVSDSAVTTTDSVSALIAEDLKKTEEEYAQKQELTHVIYDIEYDAEKGLIDIDYLSKTNCAVFVGFYNDEGTELYSSLTKNVQASDNGQVQLTVVDELPEHYLIKAYLIGNHQNALCKALTYEKCTKAMQEILAKTTDDFTEKDVINFDEDKSNNFFVVADNVVNIQSDAKNDTYDGTVDGKYHFSNVKEIAKLTEKSVVVIETPDDLLTFKVSAIENKKDGSSVITPDSNWKPEIDNIFKFIKVNTEEMAQKPEFEVVEFTEDGTPYKVTNGQTEDGTPYKVITPEKEVNQRYNSSVSPVPGNTIIDSDKVTEDSKSDHVYKQVEFGISDTCTFTVSLDVNFEYYIGFNEKFYDYDVIKTYRITASAGKKPDNNSLEIPVKSAETKVDHRLHTPTFSIPINGAMKISFDAEVSVKLLGCIDVTYTEVTHHTYDNGIETTNTEKSRYDCVLRGEFTLDVSFNITFSVISEKILAGVLTVSVGITIYGIINPGGEDGDRKHNCDVCLDITSFLYAGFKVSVKVLDQTVASRTVAEIRTDIPKLNLSKKYGLIEGDCQNYSYLMKYHVKDQKGNPIEGVELKSDGKPLLNKMGKTSIKTNKDGYAEFWVDMSDIGDEVANIKGTAPTKETDEFCVYGYYSPDSEKAMECTRTIKLKKYETDDDKKDDDDSDKSVNTYTGSSGPHILEQGYTGIERASLYYIYWSDNSMTFLGKGTLWTRFYPRMLSGNFSEVTSKQLNKATVLGKDIEIPHGLFNDMPYEYIDMSNAQIKEWDTHFAFRACKNLKELKLPENLEIINNNTFDEGCSLKNIVLPESLKTIDRYGFYESNFEELVLPSKVEYIGEYAFTLCAAKNIYLNEGLKTIANYAFEHSKIESIVIPESVKYVGEGAFSSCNDLKKVIINSEFATNDSENEVSTGKQIFALCPNLNTVYLSDNVKTIWPEQFKSCSSLKNIRLSNNLTTIKDHAFQSAGIEEITLPESVETIEEEVFSGSALKKITVLNPECSIGKYSIPLEVVIYGYTNSTAHKYALANGNQFVPLDPETIVTTIAGTTTRAITTTTTTTTAETTTTAPATTVYTYTNAVPDTEYVLIAVKDASAIKTEKTEDGKVLTADEQQLALLSSDNILFFDQQTANEKKEVSFSFVEPKVEKVTYILVGDFGSHEIDRAVSEGKPEVTSENTETFKNEYISETKEEKKEEEFELGDANGDGIIALNDAVLIMQFLANPSKFGPDGSDPNHITEEGLLLADVVGDNDGVTAKDALEIQKFMLGLIKSLPDVG